MCKVISQKLWIVLLGFLVFTGGICELQASNLFCGRAGDFQYNFFGMAKEELFYGKNISLLNSNVHADKIFYFRHTLDLSLDVGFGIETYGHDAVEFYFTFRNRAIWGNPQGITQTTPNTIKISESVTGFHNHYNPRLFPWIREIWLKWDIADLCCLGMYAPHTFKLGAFPFILGRGITLGDAYGTGPEILGFYTDSAVDQYAFGGLFSGWILENSLSYDVYGAILQNKSSSLRQTGERIYGQEYGRLRTSERGFGIVNFVIAGRFDWFILHDDCTLFFLEPYWLFNDDPEQRVEFLGDARSCFGSIGLAGEYKGEKFACGFDTAVNLGHQQVRGWDRNTIRINNINGALNEINSHVIYKNPNDANDPQNGKKISYLPGSDGQQIIEEASRNAVNNGKLIGIVGNAGDKCGYLEAPVYLTNSNNRFRDPYRNKYNGWMFVADAALRSCQGNLECAGTIGIASGDDNPNFDTKDESYDGFIGLQEIYSGKRVRSAYVLGSRKLARPLSFPVNRTGGLYATSVSDFTNLRFIGGGTTYTRAWEDKRKLYLHSSVIAYWQDFPSKAYNAEKKKEYKFDADPFLGLEFNLFFDYYLYCSLKLFAVVAVFIPGAHFDDIRGKPINEEQLRILDRHDRTGFLRERIPNVGNNAAFMSNIGAEFKF